MYSRPRTCSAISDDGNCPPLEPIIGECSRSDPSEPRSISVRVCPGYGEHGELKRHLMWKSMVVTTGMALHAMKEMAADLWDIPSTTAVELLDCSGNHVLQDHDMQEWWRRACEDSEKLCVVTSADVISCATRPSHIKYRPILCGCLWQNKMTGGLIWFWQLMHEADEAQEGSMISESREGPRLRTPKRA